MAFAKANKIPPWCQATTGMLDETYALTEVPGAIHDCSNTGKDVAFLLSVFVTNVVYTDSYEDIPNAYGIGYLLVGKIYTKTTANLFQCV